jgi:hypothetical protein
MPQELGTSLVPLKNLLRRWCVSSYLAFQICTKISLDDRLNNPFGHSVLAVELSSAKWIELANPHLKLLRNLPVMTDGFDKPFLWSWTS